MDSRNDREELSSDQEAFPGENVYRKASDVEI